MFPPDLSVVIKCFLKSQLCHVAMINTNDTCNTDTLTSKILQQANVAIGKDVHTEIHIYQITNAL